MKSSHGCVFFHSHSCEENINHSHACKKKHEKENHLHSKLFNGDTGIFVQGHRNKKIFH